jgi:hypothetical protein
MEKRVTMTNWDDSLRAFPAQNERRTETARRQNEKLMQRIHERIMTQQQQPTTREHHSKLGWIVLGILIASRRIRHAWIILAFSVLCIGLISAAAEANNGVLAVLGVGMLLVGLFAEVLSWLAKIVVKDVRQEWQESQT